MTFNFNVELLGLTVRKDFKEPCAQVVSELVPVTHSLLYYSTSGSVVTAQTQGMCKDRHRDLCRLDMASVHVPCPLLEIFFFSFCWFLRQAFSV